MIEIDVDDFSADEMIAMYGKKLAAVPVFLAIGDDGRSTGPQITSSAWGDDIPENMAPPLAGFFGKLSSLLRCVLPRDIPSGSPRARALIVSIHR